MEDLPCRSRILLIRQVIADKTREIVDRFITTGRLQPASPSPSPPASPALGSSDRSGGGGSGFASRLELPRAEGS